MKDVKINAKNIGNLVTGEIVHVHARSGPMGETNIPQDGSLTRGKSFWIPGAYDQVTRLVDSKATVLDSILNVAVRALGSGFGEVLTREYATGAGNIAREVYDAIRSQTNLKYDWEPATPAETSQEIRIARVVLSNGRATCLDAALLYAALLERAHLAPALIFVTRSGVWHAISGFFKNDVQTNIAHVVTASDEVLALFRAGNIVPVETTGLCEYMGKKNPFSIACEDGLSLISHNDGVAIVNVLAGRSAGLKAPE